MARNTGERLLGVGEFPSELDCANWGAVLFSFWWAALHGLGKWAGAFFVLGFAQTMLWYLMRRTHADASLRWVLLATLISTLADLGLSALLGVRANRAVWERERGIDPSDPHPGNRSGPSIAKYMSRERIWVIVAVVLVGVGYVNAFMGPRRVSFFAQRMWLGLVIEVIVLGGLFLADRFGLLRRVRS